MNKKLSRALTGALIGVALMAGLSVAYVRSLNLTSQPLANVTSLPSELEMMQASRPPNRGRILAVVTSTAKAGPDIAAGLELTELSRAYYTFIANGYEVDIASPKGGRPPVRMDDELLDVDYAFLNDPAAMQALTSTLPINEVDASRYDAIYFVGGKGTMFDFPENAAIQAAAVAVYESGGVVGAVCHGPAALLGAKLKSGQMLLDGKRVTGFTNEEELFIIKNAREVFPFLLEDALAAEAGSYSSGPKYLDHTVIDGRLVTGQNPWSTWSVAEGMIRALGHEPIPRPATREEIGISVLEAFHAGGIEAALIERENLGGTDKRLMLMHAMIAVMERRFEDAYNLHRLAH